MNYELLFTFSNDAIISKFLRCLFFFVTGLKSIHVTHFMFFASVSWHQTHELKCSVTIIIIFKSFTTSEWTEIWDFYSKGKQLKILFLYGESFQKIIACTQIFLGWRRVLRGRGWENDGGWNLPLCSDEEPNLISSENGFPFIEVQKNNDKLIK